MNPPGSRAAGEHLRPPSSHVAALLLAAAALCACAGGTASARVAGNGLVYSSASSRSVQRQPAAGACRARHRGLYSLPDPRCTPGALNPAVTQATIASTICRSGWTATVRPPESVSEPEKLANMRAYGLRTSSAFEYEYDHLVPLELGGATNDPRNLWPEPDYTAREGFYLNPKDKLERALNRMVCNGAMSLSHAQLLSAREWVAAYRLYG